LARNRRAQRRDRGHARLRQQRVVVAEEVAERVEHVRNRASLDSIGFAFDGVSGSAGSTATGQMRPLLKYGGLRPKRRRTASTAARVQRRLSAASGFRRRIRSAGAIL
jgi:hypothetical protein